MLNSYYISTINGILSINFFYKSHNKRLANCNIKTRYKHPREKAIGEPMTLGIM